MKITLTLLLIIHGMIHFFALTMAFNIGEIAKFSKEISKPYGIIWLCTGLLFIFIAISYFLNNRHWITLLFVTVFISQLLIFMSWKDTKFGTIANLIFLAFGIISFSKQHFENTYKNDVILALKSGQIETYVITEKDIEAVPPIVQKHLRYVGVIGKPKIYNMKLTFEGEMRNRGASWFKFTSEQYNFFETPKRLFFMKAQVKGLPTYGYHKYQKQGADMDIKILSIVPLIQMHNQELFTAETVTFFNELCLYAPAALINDEIKWETINDLTVKASFETYGNAISATLFFNENGQLVNFLSHDRYAVSELKTYPYATPVKNYKSFNGFNLPTYGEAIWHYSDGEFVYGKFHLKSVAYNVAD